MIISIIAALANNNVIGIKNSLPWKLPADLAYFREQTLNKACIMGQKTFESIGSKPLSGRRFIILTKDPNFLAPQNCQKASSVQEALELAKDEPEVMVSGGASVYSQFLPLAQRLYLTYIKADFEGDVFFPEFDIKEWQEVKRVDNGPDESNPYYYSFVILEKIV